MLKRCVRFPHAYMAIFPSGLWNWEDKFFTILGDLLFSWRVSMKISNMPSVGNEKLDFLEKVFLLSCFITLAFVLSCCQLSCWGKNLKHEKIKTYLLPFWLTDCSKNVNVLGKNIFSMKFPNKDFKILAERKRCSFRSLRHPRMSLASGKLLWFSTGVHQRSKLNLFIQTQAPWTENVSQAFLSSLLWGADNPQAPQISWDCTVFLWLKSHCSLPPASLACFNLRTSLPKPVTKLPSPQNQLKMWNTKIQDQHDCKHSQEEQS